MNLNWPAGFARTSPGDRERTTKFKATLGATTKELAAEMNRLDVEDYRGEIGNQHTKSNGLPLHNANPDDPGFVLRWTKDGEQFAVACDHYTSLRNNVRAVYLWVRETRLRGQRPVVTGDTEFAAARLPSGDEDEAVVGRQPAHRVLEVDPHADASEVEDAYREKVKEVHPDLGGSNEAFRRVKEARDRLLNGGEA